MTRLSELSTDLAEQVVVITRVVDAPRAMVFKAWTDPQRVAQWWGPRGFTNPVCELDVRPGGAIRIDMRGPDGTVYPMTGAYRDIVEPQRLVFTSAALDEKGQPLFEVLNTVMFAEPAAAGGKTTLTLHARVVKTTTEAERYLAGMEAGWTQTLERLGDYLATVRPEYARAARADAGSSQAGEDAAMSAARIRLQDRTAVDVSLLLVRVIVGVIFAAHGAQKLFGAFDGPGLTAMVKMMGPIGYLVTIGEFFGGLGLIVGFLCRFSAASIIVIMIGAIAMVHGRNGFFLGTGPDSTLSQAGFEYNLALIGLLAPILLAGAGRFAIGRLLRLPRSRRTGRPIAVLE